MGGGYYSQDVAAQLRSGTRRYDWNTAASPGAQPRVVHPALNPLGKRREVNNETPIVVALDVTRSRGDDTKQVYAKLPVIMGLIELEGYVKGPGIGFAAVGDADADRAPLQVSQFEADNRMDENLERFWIEEGGGGTGQESYELCAYFYSRTNCVRLARGDGKKGYFFFVGDEGFYPNVSKSQVKRLIGDDLAEDMPSREAFRRLQEKFHVFLVYPKKTVEERRSDIDAEIRARVVAAGGQYDHVDIRASLLWNNRNDLDLHVVPPSAEEVYFGHKKSACGGWLDVDMNVMGDTIKPVENVRWSQGSAPPGVYRVYVQNFRYYEAPTEPTPFRVELDIGGEVQHLEGVIAPHHTGASSNTTVAEFQYDPNRNRPPAAQDDQYKQYSDEVVLGQWASVIPREHILRIDDARSIHDVLLGALAIASGSRDLPTYLADLRRRGATDVQVAQIGGTLQTLAPPNVGGEVVGDVPAGAPGRPGRSKRL